MMAANFSKVWLNHFKTEAIIILLRKSMDWFLYDDGLRLERVKSSWPQLSSHVTHLLCDHVIFAKICISSFTMPITIKLGRVRVKRPHFLFQVTYQSIDHMVFEKRHVFTNARPQNSAEYIKHRKTHKSKAFLLIKRYLNHIDIHHFKDIYIAQVSSLPYCFNYIYSGIVWGLIMDIKIIHWDSPVQAIIITIFNWDC